MNKCRAWHKIEKRMIYADEIKDQRDLWAIGFHGLPIAVDSDSFRGDEIIGWNIDHFLEVMQCIGDLTDKAGKEIYEDDIVAPGLDEECVKTIVKIGRAETSVDTYERSYAKPYYGVYLEGCVDLEEYLLNGQMYILGNIHENPELLKEL